MIAIILGTRPEIIKCSSIIKNLQKQHAPFAIIHTNQHYDANLDLSFFEQLKLPTPNYRLASTYTSSAHQVGTMIIDLERCLKEINPNLVLVQGDTNTAQAGALAASKLHIPIGHVEAGLRSYDRKMPEELNRIVCDHLAQLHFVPTQNQEKILLSENIPKKQIHIVGNTIIDAVLSLKNKINDTPLKQLGVTPNNFILATIHRPENVDNHDELQNIITGLKNIYAEYKTPIVFPIHPRTKKQINNAGISIPSGIIASEPQAYLEFLALEKYARAILTDSGGVQEEACILNVPCITIRQTTERPETVDVGANIIAGTDPANMLNALKTIIHRSRTWHQPFGDGTTGKQIVDICAKFIESKNPCD